jgi:putative thioredoxin
MMAAGDAAGAVQRCRDALAMDPRHPGAALALAQRALESGDPHEARRLAGLIEENTPQHEAASGLLARLDFAETCQDKGGREQCERSCRENPGDLDARHDLACCLAADGRWTEAMEELLGIVAKEKHYRDDAAKDTMVRIFSIIGQRSKLADEYRDRLMRILY